MRSITLAPCWAAFLLVGCSSEPPQIPADIYEAGQFCMAAKMLAMRDADGRELGDPSSISAVAKQQAYPMIAASKSEDFGTFLDEGDLVQSTKVVSYGETFDPSQFDQLVAQCDAHFGISDALAIPTLPQDEFDAVFSCYAASHSMQVMVSQPQIDNQGKGLHYLQVLERMTAQKDLAAARRGGISIVESENRTVAGLKYAFSQGNLMNYVAACDAKYREGRS